MTSALVKKPEKRIVGFSGPVKKILIVDDKWENRAVLSNMLKPLGFNVAEAADGRDAIKQACAFKPDLILMDLIMPVMDGFQATRKIRKLKRLKDVRVIALSASAFEHNRQQSLEAGCEDFIPKPVRSEVLFKKLRTHLKLKWTYDHETGDTLTVDLDAGVPSQPLTGPPPALAIQLNELAMMGDVQAILAKLDELEKNDGQLHAFNSELRRLAKNYSMKKIREFLKPFLKNME
jgi:CheY-like chemotaxis protein